MIVKSIHNKDRKKEKGNVHTLREFLSFYPFILIAQNIEKGKKSLKILSFLFFIICYNIVTLYIKN